MRKLLSVLVQYPDGRTKSQLALLAGYSAKGGGFNNALSRLRTEQLINRGEPIVAAEGALNLLGEVEALPTGEELFRYWLNHPKVKKAERAILEALRDQGGGPLEKEELADLAGYEPTGGGFNNALSKLRTLELVTGRGDIALSDELFEAVM